MGEELEHRRREKRGSKESGGDGGLDERKER